MLWIILLQFTSPVHYDDNLCPRPFGPVKCEVQHTVILKSSPYPQQIIPPNSPSSL